MKTFTRFQAKPIDPSRGAIPRALLLLELGLFLVACKGFPPTASAQFNETIELTAENPAQVLTFRVTSDTVGARTHQLNVTREETCQGRPRGPNACEEIPDVLLQIEGPSRPPAPARAFEASRGCWYGDCEPTCYDLSSSSAVVGKAPDCDGAAQYLVVECNGQQNECEQTFRVRLVLGNPDIPVTVPVTISLIASGDEEPITATLTRVD